MTPKLKMDFQDLGVSGRAWGFYASWVGKYGGYMKYVGCAYTSLGRIYGRATCIPDQQTSTSPRTMRAMSG